jgi:hypothetical protein
MIDTGGKTVLSVQVATAQRDRLARLAAAHERSLSGEMRRALDTYIRLNQAAPSQVPAARDETSEPRQSSSSPAGSGEAA